MTLAAHGFATALYLFAAFLGWTRRGVGNGKRRVPYAIALAALDRSGELHRMLDPSS